MPAIAVLAPPQRRRRGRRPWSCSTAMFAGRLAGGLGYRNLKVVQVRELDDPADEEQQDGCHETKFDGDGAPLAPFDARRAPLTLLRFIGSPQG